MTYTNNPYDTLKKHKAKLTAQQYRTIKGQIRAGDPEGAMKGLASLLKRGGGKNGNRPQRDRGPKE